MFNYHCVYIPGGTFLFIVVTYKQILFLTHPNAKGRLCTTWYSVQEQYPFYLIALYFLLDHLHCIWKLSGKDADYSTRWQKIKNGFSQKVDGTILYYSGFL